MTQDQWFERYIEGLETRLSNMESKMDELLSFKWQIIGGSVLISGIIGIVVALIAGALSRGA